MRKYNLENRPLDLTLTLASGQAFRWKKSDDGVWRGVVGDRIISLKKENSTLLWEAFPDCDFQLISNYLRLDDDVESIYNALTENIYTKGLVKKFHGLRLLKQDTEECLLSFICSAANSIPKISAAIDQLSKLYGKHIADDFYMFPTATALAGANIEELCAIKPLAFRGKNISSVANELTAKNSDWLQNLEKLPHQEARQSLTSLYGVGKKIADCVCLFALGKNEVVPVDTHVRQIASRLFLTNLTSKTITDKVYNEIQAAFIKQYGKNAGWAQQFLFYNEIFKKNQ